MAKLTPYLVSEDARAQADFYINALGGEILSVMTHGQLPDASEAVKDKVLHMSLVAGGINFFMSDSVYAPLNRGNGLQLSLEFPTEAEAREAFTKLGEDGTVKHPLEPAFWGSLFGQIEDKYGVIWMITNEAQTSQA
ncbi:glyoxalase [Paenibacillus sp. A3]|uniref:VOC family protein n=1 Tax=Paenibacillus sp. A3 TaxID=1337054 RepID=UPI0006D580E8|nr:VOC family protein [Paenibacillus sp. A3]KPV60408.1 glyoxalase [Paenibacillus sp. A3]